MSAQFFQLQDDLYEDDHDEIDHDEIDYEEIDWDEFANLDMIDDLSENETEKEPVKVEVKKPFPKIDSETQSLMEAHKDLLRWVNLTVEHSTREYSEEEYPTLSSKVEVKDRTQKFTGKGRPRRLSLSVLCMSPYGFTFQGEEQPADKGNKFNKNNKNNKNNKVDKRPSDKAKTKFKKTNARKPQPQPPAHQHIQPLMNLQVQPAAPAAQPLMNLQVQAPKKVLNKLCFSFFKKEKCGKQACQYAHSIKEVDLHTLECKSFAKAVKCPLVEVVGHSKSKKLRYIKNLDGRICYGRHNYGDLTESVHSYISRTTKQFDVIGIAKQMKASQASQESNLH